MEASPTVRFAAAARQITNVCRSKGYKPPTFRSPPKTPGVDRTLRRLPNLDRCIVSVTLRGRPIDDVLADMIDGTIAALDLDGAPAEALRAALWEAVN